MGLAGIPASVEGGAPRPLPAASPPRRGDTSHGRRLPPSAPAYELPVRRCMAFAQKENLLQGYEVRRQKYLSSVCPSTYLVPVLRIRDVYPGSQILIFTHPIGSKNSNKREG